MTSHVSQNDGWVPSGALAAMGYRAIAPETDFGMRWGQDMSVRVSFAPADRQGNGFLYATNSSTNQQLLLARHTTAEQAKRMWTQISDQPAAPDAYLAFAVLDQQNTALHPRHANALLWHCLERELGAQRNLDRATDGHARFDAAHALLVHRSARVSAEDLLVGAACRGGNGADPVIVRYRIPGRPDSTGRLIAADLPAAQAETRRLIALGEQVGLKLQATSVSHGRTTVAASRVPEVAFAAVARDVVPSNAPRLAL